MIKIENIVPPSPEQMMFVVRAMRNPMNSWKKNDSYINDNHEFVLGENDRKLMSKLAESGTDHRKYLRAMHVQMDITAPLYWWKEFDTYKIGTVSNSCSTMHKIQEKEFTLDDFSHEQLDEKSLGVLKMVVANLNECRVLYDYGYEKIGVFPKEKSYWYNMIQMLPSSYNQKRSIDVTYEACANMYHGRRYHKLDEWNADFDGSLCDVLRKLPYAEFITGKE